MVTEESTNEDEGLFTESGGSIDTIVSNYFTEDPTNTQSKSQEQTEPDQPDDFISPNVVTDIDSLEKELEEARLEGKTPESIRSFEGLKSRYKNKIAEIRAKVERLEKEKAEAAEKIAILPDIQAKVNHYDNLVAKTKRMEEDLEKAKKEASENSYFRKKYDFENDPEIRRSFIAPMQELKRRCTDIIANVGLDEHVWNELVKADSEYRINHIIDSADISGLNAQSLKNYVYQYKELAREYSKASAPEYIDSAIEAAIGKNKRISEEVATKSFNDIKDAFSKHVREIEYSDLNKEHNLFVHDKVVEKAKATFDVFKKALAPEYQNPQALSSVAQAAIMASAYPFQKKLVDFLMEERTKLLVELSELSSGPSINQSTESYTNESLSDDMMFFNNVASKTIDEITEDLFK